MASVRSILISADIQLTLDPIDMFAEFLSEGWTALEIRKYMGLTEHEAQGFMKQIRDALGVPGRD